MGHQITIKEVKDSCSCLLASSYSGTEAKRLSVSIDPINKSMTFEVTDMVRKRHGLYATLKEAVEIYNIIK